MTDCAIRGGAPARLLEMSDARTTCVLVDDHPAVRAGVRTMLTAGHITVVGEAHSGEGAVEVVARRRPDVVVMDIHLGRGIDGFAAAAAIVERTPGTGVVLLTGFGERGFAARALECGARGYVLKNAPREDLVRAVRTVATGERFVDPAACLDLVAPADDVHDLTRRELEVLGLLRDGLRSAEIARRLFISRATVRSHVRNSMTKLNASTFTHAVAEAIRRRLLPG
jgi:DNA-binding NarL/FixJ family response regulator